jgi:hypothetical protein
MSFLFVLQSTRDQSGRLRFCIYIDVLLTTRTTIQKIVQFFNSFGFLYTYMGMGRFVNMFPEPPGSFDKTAGMGIFVNIFMDPDFFDKNPNFLKRLKCRFMSFHFKQKKTTPDCQTHFTRKGSGLETTTLAYNKHALHLSILATK